MIIDEIIHIDFQKNISKLKISAFMMPFSIVQQGPLLFLVSFINNDPLTSNNIKSKCVLVWCSLTVEGGAGVGVTMHPATRDLFAVAECIDIYAAVAAARYLAYTLEWGR